MKTNKQIGCVILDWAGTTVDFGCFAPVNAFIEAFEEISISISTTEVRIPMGMAKIEHVRQLLRMKRINSEFQRIYGRDWTEDDVVNLNRSFEKYLFATLTDYTTPIPRVIETVDLLRKKGLKIGSTTGYTRAMMNIVEPSAKAKGYFPDNCITPDGLPKGRPAPFMIYRNMIDLNVQDTDCIVKVGDTIEDIREGLNAKVWSIGVVIGSNELGLTEADINDFPEVELQEKMTAVRSKMTEAGAHFVMDTFDELPKIIEHINSKLAIDY
ncbi:MAG: phosphonoacetaldehyde hydrolase [Bacteroidales bacterium]|nr:phosphonoacetaldehyde hydrolase [Bacteroidales bacterium]